VATFLNFRFLGGSFHGRHRDLGGGKLIDYRAFSDRENPTSRNLATHAFCSFFSVYMAKAIRNLSGFNKKNLVFLIRNISSKELHSALGKILVVNLMYNLLGLKNCFGLKI
jgi:hypothetical protein